MLKQELERNCNKIESYLAKSNGVGVAQLDVNLNILDCNSGFIRLFNLREHPAGEQLNDYLELDAKDIRCDEELKIPCSRKTGINAVNNCYLLQTDNGYLLFCERLFLTESFALEQVGKMNNDLINLQRESVKKNNQLEKLQHELDMYVAELEATLEVLVKERTADFVELTEQLEEKVRERTAELSEANVKLLSEIIERSRTEDELINISQRLQLATTSAGLGVWDWNIKDNVMVWEDQMMALYGHTPQTFPGGIDAWQQGLHPDDRRAAWETCQASLRGEIPWDTEFRIVRPDGSERWIKANGLVFWDPDGTPIRMLGINRDITKRKLAEIELQQSKAMLQAAMDCSPAGIAIANAPDGKLRYVNDAGLLIRGGDRQSVVNGVGVDQYVASWKILDLDGRPLRTDEAPLARAVMFGETNSRECIIRRSEGDDHIVLANAAPIKDESGNVTSGIVVFTDITERRKADEEKIKLESQLYQAQKMESVGRLAGGVAHDFNNLLTVILGGAYLALSELEPGQPLHEYVTQIKKAGEKSAELTQQLLAFARKQTIEPKILDLNDTVSGMLKMLQRLIGENTQLTWQPANNLWPVKADPSQIDQILANLCVNARDSITDIGAITIRTGNSVVDDGYRAEHIDVVPGEYVQISVCDTGCGMDKETLAHIFEPFFTTKGPGEGTGLGLATVYGAAKQNNGFVNVHSEPGIGTTFSIYLPRYVGDTGQKVVKNPMQQTPRGLEAILLVEDEPAILNMVTMLLQKQGYTVLAANSPGEATRLVSEHTGEIDLLITDVIMPEMNGKDLAHNLMSRNPKLKCLYMSGYTADAISQHGVLEEGVHFIHKPFSLPVLAVKVRKVLDGN